MSICRMPEDALLEILRFLPMAHVLGSTSRRMHRFWQKHVAFIGDDGYHVRGSRPLWHWIRLEKSSHVTSSLRNAIKSLQKEDTSCTEHCSLLVAPSVLNDCAVNALCSVMRHPQLPNVKQLTIRLNNGRLTDHIISSVNRSMPVHI